MAPDLPCPRCGRLTSSLKQFEIYQLVIFLFAWMRWQTTVYAACPACMRVIILQRTAANIIPAHVVWLGLILPFHIHQFCRTFASGHSEKTGGRALTAYNILFWGAVFVFGMMIVIAES